MICLATTLTKNVNLAPQATCLAPAIAGAATVSGFQRLTDCLGRLAKLG